jgi:repressor LexA
MSKLTKRQTEILALIQSHIDETGSPPTRAEIAKTMGFKSPNAAEDHLRALARKGAIELVPGTSRGIRLGRSNGGIPLLGKLDLEQPTLSDVNILNTIKIDRQLFGPVTHFMVQVDTKQLQDLGVLKGDYVAIHQTNKAELGQIVAIRKNQEIQLRAFSHDMQHQNHVIEGIVVGVVRSLSKASLS